MHSLKLLFTYYVLKFSWIIIFIVKTNLLFSFIIINRFFFHFVINILGGNDISAEGAIGLAEALKLNNNLAHLNLGIFLLLLT